MAKLVLLSDDDYEFLVGFDPDRDRTASRRDMVDVVQHIQDSVRGGVLFHDVDIQTRTEPLGWPARP